MRTYQHLVGDVLKGVAAAAAAALVLAGCATVNLGPDTNAPQVRMPGDTPVTPPPQSRTAPAPQSMPVQTMPVASSDTVTQPQLLPPDSADSGLPAADSSADSAPANTHLVTLTTRPDGASEVPPTSSGATAQLDLLYDSGTRLLRWKAEWTNLSSPITAVSFYGPAAQGQTGTQTLIWPGPFGPRYEGRATLTPQQATDLMGGLWYVNISTINYSGGEIRGQLRVVY